jgi:hypothetical protein
MHTLTTVSLATATFNDAPFYYISKMINTIMHQRKTEFLLTRGPTLVLMKGRSRLYRGVLWMDM